MIAVSSKGKSFRALAMYLAKGRSGTEHERVAWSVSRNLPTADPELAVKLMRATAHHNHRVQKPVYHLALSFDPNDPVNRARMEQIADRVLHDLGLSEHQAVIVAHQDRAHPHLHLLVNRVHPETARVWDLSHDYRRIQQTLRDIEREFGLREVPGRLAQLSEHETPDRAPLTNTERRVIDRAGMTPLVNRMRAQLPAFRDATSWADLEARLADHGVRVEPRGQGLIVTDGHSVVKASRIGRDFSKRSLEARFGVRYEDRATEIHPNTPKAVARDVRRYSYVRWLTQQQYATEVAAGDARAVVQGSTLHDQQRVRASQALATAFAPVYGDPTAAERHFEAMVRARGERLALSTLRDHPEQYGPLRTAPRARLGGLVITADAQPARDAAVQAVAAARTYVTTVMPGQHDHDASPQTPHVLRRLEREITRRQEEFRGLRPAHELEASINQAIVRLLPTEMQHLRTMLSRPDLAVTRSVRESVTRALVGDERER